MRDFPEWQTHIFEDIGYDFFDGIDSLNQTMSWGMTINEGWKELIHDALYLLLFYKEHGMKIAQIKEKFGGLRIYVHWNYKYNVIESVLRHVTLFYSRTLYNIHRIPCMRWIGLPSLTYYYKPVPIRKVEDLIMGFEKQAAITCECCGAVGQLRTEGVRRHKTLCDGCN